MGVAIEMDDNAMGAEVSGVYGLCVCLPSR